MDKEEEQVCIVWKCTSCGKRYGYNPENCCKECGGDLDIDEYIEVRKKGEVQ